MNIQDIKFDFDDITIVPEIQSDIRHRSEVNPFIDIHTDTYLPIMTAPMDTVVDWNNHKIFQRNKIIPALPRHISLITSDKENLWYSISLEKAKIIADLKLKYSTSQCFIIDIAQGHLKELYDVVKKLREDQPYVNIIVGNIANPKTYQLFAELGVYGVRCGIGGGQSCTSSANLGVHYPMGSLIQECYEIKKAGGYSTKIIADGGMRKYSDIIKSLALGADLVMVGSLFNKALESCTTTFLWKKIGVYGYFEQWLYNHKFPLYKKFRGMSTKEVQRHWGKEKLTTAEGIVRWNTVQYTLPKWVDNFESYLRSAMSYTGSHNLEEFKECGKILITENAYRRFNK